MGTVQTIRPNANRSGAADFTNTGGGSLYGALSDSSDATYITKNNVEGVKTYAAELGTYTVAAGYKCKRARAALRVDGNNTTAKYTWRYGSSAGSGWSGSSATSTSKDLATLYTAWDTVLTSGASSTEFTQAVIDALNWSVDEWYKSTRSDFLDGWVELDIIDQPTVTVSAGATSTLKPTIAFTYADGDGDVQTKYRVKVFDSATYGGGGFDAETSTPVWDSGELTGTAASVAVATSLTNATTYKAYVKVAHDGGASDYWSAWTASSAWTTSVTTCTTPTVTGIYSEGDGRVELTVTGAAPPGGVTQTLRVERSTDGGTTWVAVRDWAGATFDTPYSETVYDYEAPLGQAVDYRARALGVNGSGEDLSSPWSATNTENPWVSTWMLKCPVDPTLNVLDTWVLASPEITVEETIGVFRPIGASKAVTVAGDLYGEDGTWAVRAHDDDDQQSVAAVAAILTAQAVLYVSDPFGGNRYVRIISRSRSVEGTGDYPRTVWSVGYVEVDMPAVE